MFAFKPRKELEIAVRILLTAVILLNALALNPVTAKAAQNLESPTVLKAPELKTENHSIPTFARPETRAGNDTSNVALPNTKLDVPNVGCYTWNLANDFRVSPNQENPNRDSCNNLGVWKFMASTTLTRDPATYYPMTIFGPSAGGYTGLDFWSGNFANQNGKFPGIGFNGSGADRGFTNQAITIPANTVDIHPGPSQLGIIAWQSPLSGYVSITGDVSDNDPDTLCPAYASDGIKWYLDKNSTSLADGVIPPGGFQNFANGNGGTSLNTVAVNVGDVIYLAIDPNGSYGCDSTRVDLSISDTSASAIPKPSTTSGGSVDTCLGSTYSAAMASVAGPINTHTGGYDYTNSDISISTSAGDLNVEREYTSLSVNNP